MLDEILAFSSGDFYQTKSEEIGSSVRNYADLRSQGADLEALSLAKTSAEETITRIMIDNGFAPEDTAYISLEQEFFDETGTLDNQKLEQFQKEMLKHYSLQQVKWSFSGTADSFTPITKRSLEKLNQDYLDLLPVPLKNEKKLKEQRKYAQHKDQKSSQANTYDAFLYADGTVSEEALPAKTRVQFDRLKDDSGFDWKKGYSPDNVIRQKNGVAGFNKEGVWEKYVPRQKRDTAKGTGRGDLGSLSHKAEKDEIGLFQSKDENILFDKYSLLKEGGEQVYYSITGEVYGARAIDRERSLDSIREALKKNQIEFLSGIVLKENTPELIDYYRKALAGYVNSATVFYDQKTSEELDNKLRQLREAELGNAASEDLAVRLFALNEQLLSPEEIYENLATNADKPAPKVPLQLFKDKEDLQVFMQLPELDALDPDTRAYLESLNVPEEKAGPLSNAVQNLLYNYPSLFKHANLSRKELLHLTEKVIVKNEEDASKLKERIATEKNLFDFIKESAAPGKKTDIPSFSQTYKKDQDYYTFNNAAQLDAWLEKELATQLSSEARDKLRETVKQSALFSGSSGDSQAFAKALQNTFKEFPAIAMSTGMTPAELVKQIEAVLTGQPNAQALKSKRIFFEKQLGELIKEAALGNPHNVKALKAEPAEGQKRRLVWKPFERDLNLFISEDRDHFLKSTLIQSSGLETDDVKLLEHYLTSANLPVSLQKEFSEGLINAVRGYPYQLKTKGIGLEQALSGLEKILANAPGSSGLSPELEKSIRRAAGLSPVAAPSLKAQRAPVQTLAALDELINQDLDTFLASPLIAEAGLSRDDAGEVQDYLKQVREHSYKQTPANQKLLAGSLLNTISRFRSQIAARSIKPLAALQAVTSAVNRNYSKVPTTVRQAIRQVVSPVGAELAAKNAVSSSRRAQNDPARILQNLVGQDAEAFSRSSYLTESGLSADEATQVQSHLREVLSTSKLTGASGKLFAKGVLNTLKEYQKSFKGRGVSPIDLVNYVKAATEKNKSYVPADLQAELSEALQKPLAPETITAGGTASKPADEGAALLNYVANPDQSGMNIFSQEGINRFMETNAFKRSGLHPAQLAGLINQYKRASGLYGHSAKNYAFKPLPFIYRSISSVDTDFSGKDSPAAAGFAGSGHTSALSSTTGQNSMYNLGYMVKKSKNLRPSIYFTEAGKNKLTMLMGGVNNQAAVSALMAKGGDAQASLRTETAPILDTAAGHNGTNSRDGVRQNLAEMEKALQPFVYSSSGGAQMKKTFNSSQGGSSSGKLNFQSGNAGSGNKSFDRSEQNYMQDKQMLASPVQHTAGNGSSGAQGGGGADKNILRETADEFINTIKRILKDSL